MDGNIIILNPSQIVTPKGKKALKGKAMGDISVTTGDSIVIENGVITRIAKTEEILKSYDKSKFEVIDAEGKAVLPGFVDSHTHFIFGGYREEEFSWRLNGESYMSIMEKGGGIVNSVRSTREASFKELHRVGKDRLKTMVDFGVTTVEGKSGYGLDLDTEIKQLDVMNKLNEEEAIDIVTTYLGAHATPLEYKGRTTEYVKLMIDEIIPKIKDKATFCDVFCEKNVFSVEESREILLKAKELGMKLKLHADEIVQLGGAELAGELKATSADHLLQASDNGIKAMAENDVVATLLPLTAFSLREHYARGREMIDNGCAVALASDLNPGSCFSNAIPLLIALSAIEMRLSIAEIVTALTLNGAAAVGKAGDRGSIEEGKIGDIIILKYPSYKFLPYHVGVNIVERVIKRGKLIK